MWRALAIAVLATTLLGCGSPSKGDSAKAGRADASVPPFALKLRSVATDNRYTYFEIERDGAFAYGGGRRGAQRMGEPLGTLAPEQRAEVWRIIRAYNLDHAPDQKPDENTRVKYELTIATGVLGSTLHTSDERTPGMKELHDYLFSLQAAERFQLPVMKR